jgi:transposase
VNRSSAFRSVPADTAWAAKSVLKEDSIYRILAGEMQSLFTLCRADLLDHRKTGNPAHFLRFTIITLLQEAERLTDGQAEAATRSRTEWKYALHLPMVNAGPRSHELCLFRQGLLSAPAAGALVETIQSRVTALGLWPHLPAEARPFHDTISFVCRLNQTSWLAAALEQAVEELAMHYPDWLRQIALPHWYTRYTVQWGHATCSGTGDEVNQRREAIRADIAELFQALSHSNDPAPSQLPGIRRLRRTWQQHCDLCEVRNRQCISCTRCVIGASIADGPS